MSLLDSDLITLKTLLEMSLACPKTQVQPVDELESVVGNMDIDDDYEDIEEEARPTRQSRGKAKQAQKRKK